MNVRFRKLIDSLQPQLEAIVNCQPFKRSSIAREIPEAGIYLFSEGQKHLYVGRSAHLRSRILEHGRPSGDSYTATFAFLIARHQTGKTKASYKSHGSRQDLLRDPKFLEAFSNAKTRVARCDIRYVEENDPIRQAVLEIFIAISLGTPYNSFDTH
jgi:hypothetical protein